VALKCAAPGVCDLYQGCELWDLSLVDPDNRRPVDFDRRRALLAGLDAALEGGPAARAALAREVSAPGALADGRAKLLLLREALRLRRAEPALFLAGEHWPLAAGGDHAPHVFALARVHPSGVVVAAVPRLVLRLADEGGGRIGWRGVLALPSGLPRRYRDVVTGERREGDALPLAALFGSFPVALLRSE
jgi:(1->4)-alpha-D-glucan 1-alpha-D-glucosylmutase